MGARHSIDVEASIGVMVLKRLCDPDSTLGVLRWPETVRLPGVMVESIEHQHLLRSMDAIVEHKDEVEQVSATRRWRRSAPIEAAPHSTSSRHFERRSACHRDLIDQRHPTDKIRP